MAHSLACRYASIARSRFFVESDDLAGAAILGFIQRRPMAGAIVDELRKLGGRHGHGPRKHFLAEQLDGAIHERPVDCNNIAALGLKRCGVLILDLLPARLRRLMLLRYWHGLSQRETADLLGVSSGRAGQLERAAAIKLRCELARRGIRSMRDVI